MAKPDEFNDQTRESAAVVEQCRQLLKYEWMETAYRNIVDYKEDVALKFMKSLHKFQSYFVRKNANTK